MTISSNSVMSAALASWLDTFMAASNDRVQEVQTQRDELTVKAKLYTELRTKLMNLRSQVRELMAVGSASPFSSKLASGGDEDILGVSVATSTAVGNHTVHIQQVAHAHTLASNRLTSADTTLGTAWAGTQTFTMHIAGADYAVSVDLTATMTNHEVLSKISAAINDAAGTAAHASTIADTATTSRMSLLSGATGTANAMTFDDPAGLLAAVGVTAATAATDTVGGYIFADLGNGELDAKLKVDGLAISRSTNTIKDVLSGVTLTLKRAQLDTESDVSFTLDVDTDAIRTKMTALLTAYNESYTYVSSKIAIDRSTYKRGPLASDSSYSSLWQRMRLAVAGPISTSGDVNFGALSQVGITSSKDGSFSISDPGKFDAALKGDLETVVKMFTSEDGVATRLEKLLGEYVLGEGVISRSSTSVRTQQKILDDRIARMQSLQELERDRLIEQYAAIQQAQNSQSGLLTMLSNLSTYLSS